MGYKCDNCQSCECCYVGEPPEQRDYTNYSAHVAFKNDTGKEIECYGLQEVFTINDKVSPLWDEDWDVTIIAGDITASNKDHTRTLCRHCAFMLRFINEQYEEDEEVA